MVASFSTASKAIGHVSAPGRGDTLVATQLSAHAISYREPTAQLLPVSRKTRERSRTVPAPRGPGVKHGRSSSGVCGSTKTANARLGFGSGMATGDAETGAVPTVGTASAGSGGVGVDRVILGILENFVTKSSHEVSGGSDLSAHTKSETF